MEENISRSMNVDIINDFKNTFKSLALVKHDNKFLSEKGLRIHGMSATCVDYCH